MRTHSPARSRRKKLKATVGIIAASSVAALAAAPADAGDGGTGTGTGGGSGSGAPAPTGHARLVRGKAIAPSDAPARVVGIIDAANRIRKKPYRYGGGHSKFRDSGYDCSGSVSYALHGGRFLRRPLDSSGLMHWGRSGRTGKWFSVFANGGHAFMIVAGLRFDTSMVRGSGPGWSKDIHAEHWRSFRKRHKHGY